ncbi:MAG: branched-chain amino acid ABC transporter permease, partial [Acidimicrobiia bacterium]|nr:branched-chain amino acid ABC transporter permease [Acidimicrobiia bacterium]
MLGGMLVGGRIALIALGFALVYRASRVVNFAQGDLGQVPATLVVLLVISAGWSYWLALVIG